MFSLPVLLIALATGAYKSEASRGIERAASLHARGDLHAAGLALERVIELAPHSSRAYARFGVVLVSQSRRLEALGHFETAVRLAEAEPHGADSESAASHARKMHSAAALGLAHEARTSARHAAEATDLLQRALSISPANGDVYASLGASWQKRGFPGAALGALEHSATLNPRSAIVLHNAGTLALSLGRPFDAARHFAASIRVQPSRALAAHVMLRAMCARVDRIADERLERALALVAHADEMTSAGGTSTIAEATAAANSHWVAVAQNLLPLPLHNPTSMASLMEQMATTVVAGLHARGYAVVDHVLGPQVLAQLKLAAHELEAHLVSGWVGQPTSVRGASEQRSTRRDGMVRLSAGGSSTGSGLHAGLSSGLRAGLEGLRRLFVEGLHPALVGTREGQLPPTFPREELQFACYSHDGFYRPHRDREESRRDAPGGRDVVVSRTHTAIYYSNARHQQADGGELRLWPAKGTTHEAVDIEPLADRLVVFESSLVHEVRAYHGSTPRCAFTQWFSALDEAIPLDAIGLLMQDDADPG